MVNPRLTEATDAELLAELDSRLRTRGRLSGAMVAGLGRKESCTCPDESYHCPECSRPDGRSEIDAGESSASMMRADALVRRLFARRKRKTATGERRRSSRAQQR